MSHTLRQRLAQLGVRFGEAPCGCDVDVEKTLLEATEQGRAVPRLFWAGLLWMSNYIDLVNISRLARLLRDHGDPAALGALCDLAFEKNPDRKFTAIRRRCHPRKTREILFRKMAEMEVTRREARNGALPAFLKWGYYCNYVNRMEGAICSRDEILRRNRGLRLRALFGAGSRADILNWLLVHERAHARKIARELSLSYQPVYSELHRLAADRILTAEQVGNIRVFSLTGPVNKWLAALPLPPAGGTT